MNYLGILITIIGAIVLILSVFVESLSSNNILILGGILVVGGFLAHIIINKYRKYN